MNATELRISQAPVPALLDEIEAELKAQGGRPGIKWFDRACQAIEVRRAYLIANGPGEDLEKVQVIAKSTKVAKPPMFRSKAEKVRISNSHWKPVFKKDEEGTWLTGWERKPGRKQRNRDGSIKTHMLKVPKLLEPAKKEPIQDISFTGKDGQKVELGKGYGPLEPLADEMEKVTPSWWKRAKAYMFRERPAVANEPPLTA